MHAGFSSVNQLDKTYTIKNPRKKIKNILQNLKSIEMQTESFYCVVRK